MRQIDHSANREPYELGPARGASALLLHGLTGSPYDLRPLAEALADAGCRVSVPRLAGHDHIDALAQTSWTQWYASAEAALIAARRPGERMLLLGFSLGSLLALRLAALHSEWLAGLVVIGVPIAQPSWQRLAVGLLSSLRRSSPALASRIGHHARARSDARIEHTAVGLKQGFPGMPYESVAELCALQDEVWPLLPQITTPTLMLHGRDDHTAPVEGSARVSQALGSAQLQRVVLPRSYHHVVRGLDSERAQVEVLEFVARTLKLPSHG